MKMNKENDFQESPFFDWGNYKHFPKPSVLDTTLRDGYQSPLVRYPSLDEKLALLDMLMELGIEAFDVGFPISNSKHKSHTVEIAKHIAKKAPSLRLVCLSRSKIEDIAAIADVSMSAGVEIEAIVFVGSSPVRQLVEQWKVKELVKWTTKTIDFAIKEGININFACEDATRSEPQTLRTLYLAALEHGASRFTIPDTVGICNVISTTRIIQYFRERIIQEHSISLDWHGHDDRGLAVANALAAVAAGADCIHTTVLGIGERCGNTPLEPMLANLHCLCGECYRIDLLPELCKYTARMFGETISIRHPVVGQNAYSTAAGIHGAAILKALNLERPELTANVYAGVDPRLSGRDTEVQVGPLSGTANVKWKAAQLGIPFSENLAIQILNRASELDEILTDEEIMEIANSFIEAERNNGTEFRHRINT